MTKSRERGNEIRRARLDPRTYWLPDVLEREHARVFDGAWQYVGARQLLAKPGSFVTRTLGRTPVVVVMTDRGELRAFRNVCLHRCHEVACGDGIARSFTCPYHGWVYSLDGTLVHTPHAALPGGSALVRLPVATIGPLIFVATSEMPSPFDGIASEIARQMNACPLDLETLEHVAHEEWQFAANWKVGIENFLECYHCAVAHPGLSSVVDVRPAAYQLRAWQYASSQTGPSKLRGDHHFNGPIAEAQFHYVWPNCTITINPGFPNLFVNTWLPDGPERTVGFGDTFFGAGVPRHLREEMIAFNRQVSQEDDLLVESVQRGLRAGGEPQLVDREESLIAHFHELIVDAIGESWT